jgi:hypothetical protein
MKVPAIIVVASAIVALAAPSGYAASSRIAPDLGTSSSSVQRPAGVSQALKIKKLQAQLKILKAKNKALGGKSKALAGQIRGLEIQIGYLRSLLAPKPTPSVPSVLPVTLDPLVECQTSGNSCTPRQACDWWGYDCSLAEALERQAAAVESSVSEDSSNLAASVESSASESSSSEAAPVESSASESTNTTDTSVVNTIEENWEC